VRSCRTVKLAADVSALTLAFTLHHRRAADFPTLLAVAMTGLLQACSDPDSDVRMHADEHLNRLIKVGCHQSLELHLVLTCHIDQTLLDAHLGKLQVELFKAIKKVGSLLSAITGLKAPTLPTMSQKDTPLRTLRAALNKFSDLAHLVKVTNATTVYK
jgi:hypothetical protein